MIPPVHRALSRLFSILAEASLDPGALAIRLKHPGLTSLPMLRSLRAFARSDRGTTIGRIIDVGANIGQFCFMARRAWPSVDIVCIEPSPDAFAALKHNHGSDPRITFHCCALGENPAEGSMYIGRSSAQNSLCVEIGQPDLGTVSVPIHTADTLLLPLAPAPTLLKLDVQGYELPVLRGAGRLLDTVSFILIEVSLADVFANGARIEDVFALLRDRGFAYADTFELCRNPASGRLEQMDLLFARNQ